MTKQEILDKMKSLKAEVEQFNQEIFDNTEMTGEQIQRIDYLMDETKMRIDDLICNMDDIMCEEYDEYFEDDIADNVGV